MNPVHSIRIRCFSIVFALLCAPTLTLAAEATTATKGEFLGAKSTEYPAWFKESFLDLTEDLVEANKSGKRIMVFFHQNGCPYCNALVEHNLAQKDIATLMQEKFEVIALNLWGDRELTYFNGEKYHEKDLAAALKVQFTPTLLFYDEKGGVVLRLNGYRPPDRFKVELNYVALKQEKTVTARDYIKANYTPGPSSKSLHKQDFFKTGTVDLSLKKGQVSKPFAIFFEQSECPNCDILHDKVLPDKELRHIITKFDVYQLDMWSSTPVITPNGKTMTAKDWAKQLDVQFAPSIVIFNNKGEEIIRSEAEFKVFHTQGIFDYVLSNAYQTQPSFQRYLSNRADHIREEGKAVDIWQYAK